MKFLGSDREGSAAPVRENMGRLKKSKQAMGAEVLSVVNLLPSQALGVALFSYAGKLFWGIVADWDLVPDLHEFVLAIEESFAQLANTAPREPDAQAARGSQPGLSP